MKASSNTKPWVNPWSDDHPEKLTQIPKKTVGLGQQIKGFVNPGSFFDQFLGKKSPYESKFYPQKEQRGAKLETMVFLRTNYEEDQKIREETEVVLSQLKKQITLLEKSEKALSSEITKIKVEQIPTKSGIYYLRFFEWLITLIHQLVIKVEEGRTWLSTFNQRKKKRVGYWQMYKKHGTTFGLSHERVLATQTG